VEQSAAPSAAPVTSPPTTPAPAESGGEAPPFTTKAPTTAPSSSVAPTYCVDEVELIRQTGAAVTLEENTVQITGQATNSVNFEILQTWIQDGNLDEFAVRYANSEYVEVCEQYFNISYLESIQVSAACYDNFTSVSIFVYVGDNYNVDECNACTVPIDGSDDFVVYLLEVPCVPVCEPVDTSAPVTSAPITSAPVTSTPVSSAPVSSTMTPVPDTVTPAPTSEAVLTGSPTISSTGSPTEGSTAAPTPCIDKAEAVITNVSPPEVKISAEIIKITDMNSETVGFEVVTTGMDASAVSIQYDSPTGDVCYPTTDLSASIPVSAVCYDGIASVTVFVYIGDVTLDECEACKIPEDPSIEYAAVQLEIPCEPICDPVTPAPTSEAVLTGSPTISSTGSPTEGSTAAPTPCIDKAEAVITNVSPPEVEISAEIIKITDMNSKTVGFDVVTAGMDAAVVSIQYDSPTGDVCYPTTDLSAPIPVSAVCYDGIASVTVFVYIGDVTLDECGACKIPEDPSIVYAAVQLEIPCEPICDPVAPAVDCFTGPLIVTNKDACDSVDFINIQDQSNGETVTFTIKNNLAAASNFFMSFNKLTGHECVAVNDLAVGASPGVSFTAACEAASKTAAVIVLVGGTSCTDDVACSVTYKIPCSVDMMCASVRHLNDAEGFVTAEMKAAAESSQGEDAPYCIHKDFPCEGDEANMVYVCHYSTRAGYQTFCIPEGDSDIMRFYANDYCGPCEGWNGVTQAGQI
jgi:hypothetical protein